MSIGSLLLVHAYRSKRVLQSFGVSSKWLQVLAVVALTTLWLDLNTVIYLLTDVDGIAYTLQLSEDFVRQTSGTAFAVGITSTAFAGTLVFFTVKTGLELRGAVAIVALLSAVVSVIANLGFRAMILGGREYGPAITSFIPLYLSFLIPVLIFDMLLKDVGSRWKGILAAAMVGPFAAFLDGWFSFPLWTRTSGLIPILIPPMLAAGLIGRWIGIKFTNNIRSRVPNHLAAVTVEPAQ